jgi:predicted 2-oxoglutarate/Fe(II)-dependent dioxygenase YbiX
MLTNKEKAIMLTNQDAWKVYEKYVEGWKAISDEQRAKIATEVIAEDVQYSTPQHESGGRATMIEDMAAFQVRVPGGHFDVGDVSAHHDVAILTWVMVQADGTVVAKGHDQIRVSSEGKIASLITFAPPVAKP